MYLAGQSGGHAKTKRYVGLLQGGAVQGVGRQKICGKPPRRKPHLTFCYVSLQEDGTSVVSYLCVHCSAFVPRKGSRRRDFQTMHTFFVKTEGATQGQEDGAQKRCQVHHKAIICSCSEPRCRGVSCGTTTCCLGRRNHCRGLHHCHLTGDIQCAAPRRDHVLNLRLRLQEENHERAGRAVRHSCP